MSDLKREVVEVQPPPVERGRPVTPELLAWLRKTRAAGDATEEVCALVEARDAFGRAKYGQPLFHDDGRDVSADFGQEGADGLQYGMAAKMRGISLVRWAPMLRALYALATAEEMIDPRDVAMSLAAQLHNVGAHMAVPGEGQNDPGMALMFQADEAAQALGFKDFAALRKQYTRDAFDAMVHPNGRCTCAGEHECGWCKRTDLAEARRLSANDPFPDEALPSCPTCARPDIRIEFEGGMHIDPPADKHAKTVAPASPTKVTAWLRCPGCGREGPHVDVHVAGPTLRESRDPAPPKPAHLMVRHALRDAGWGRS